MTIKSDNAGDMRAVVYDKREGLKCSHIFNLDTLTGIAGMREILDACESRIVLGRVTSTNANPFDIGVTLADLQETCRQKGWDLRRATRAWQLFHIHKAKGGWQSTNHTRADEMDEILRMGLVVQYESRRALDEVFGVGKAAATLWMDVIQHYGLVIRMDTREWLAERAKRGRLYDMRIPPKQP